MPEHATNGKRWDHWPEDREVGMRSRLRSLFAPTDAGDAVAERIAVHGRELEARSSEIQTAAGELEVRESRAREMHAKVERVLREGSAELDARQAELDARAAELDRREAALAESERRVEDRRRELGAVELRGAALARREDAIDTREKELDLRAETLDELAQRLESLPTIGVAEHRVAHEKAHVLFLAGERYRLLEREGPAPRPGSEVELDDGRYRCVRVTASPLPSDLRRCALLEQVLEQ